MDRHGGMGGHCQYERDRPSFQTDEGIGLGLGKRAKRQRRRIERVQELTLSRGYGFFDWGLIWRMQNWQFSSTLWRLIAPSLALNFGILLVLIVVAILVHCLKSSGRNPPLACNVGTLLLIWRSYGLVGWLHVNASEVELSALFFPQEHKWGVDYPTNRPSTDAEGGRWEGVQAGVSFLREETDRLKPLYSVSASDFPSSWCIRTCRVSPEQCVTVLVYSFKSCRIYLSDCDESTPILQKCTVLQNSLYEMGKSYVS